MPHKSNEMFYLYHVSDSIVRIRGYLDGVDEATFRSNLLLQDGVIRQLGIIGEAVRHLTGAFRKQHPHIPWDDIAGMRDKIIHDYFGVDLGMVWLTATDDLKILYPQIENIREALQKEDSASLSPVPSDDQE